MASSRDDFVIAIRSAFLKKSYQQKFSLLTLIFSSLIVIILGSFNFKAIQYIKIGINEVIYRSSHIASLPENYFRDLNFKIEEHLSFYHQYKKNEIELKKLKEKKLLNDFLILENNKLRELINETVQSKDVYAKVLVDKDSPYLKSIVLNKGSKDNVKIGMAIVDKSYLAGKIIEVNYTNSRALLLSDLNSKIPVLLEPIDIHAVLSGTGKNHGVIEYTKDEYKKKINGNEIIRLYFWLWRFCLSLALPVGKINTNNINKDSEVNFFSDFRQLDYVKIVAYEIGSGN
jgi:rod shape-determining protein MreC